MAKKARGSRFSPVVTFLSFIVIGAVVLATGWYMLRRDDNSKDQANSSSSQNSEQTQSTDANKPSEKTGTFTGVPPKTGSGTVTLIQNLNNGNIVRLESDFKVQNGPDLYVAFGNNGTVDHDTLFAELKAIEGNQEYQVPDTIDLTKYTQVFIYCKEFSVAFSVATLQ